jgi:cellulose binding protein with CBM3 domain
MFAPRFGAVRGFAVGALVVASILSCQGPDAYYRNSGSLTGEGGTGQPGAGSEAQGSGGAAGSHGTGSGGGPVAGGAGLAVAAGGSVVDAGTPEGGATLADAGGLAGGGAPGAAGSSGLAGSTGAGGAPAACTGTSCPIKVLAECQTVGSPQEIKVWLAINDNRSTTLDLTTVTVRYWFTQDAATDMPSLAIDYLSAPFATANVTSKFAAVSPARTGANEYLEIGFAMGTAVVPAFQSSGYLELRLFDYNVQSWDGKQTDDYSFQPCTGSEVAYSSPFAGNPWPNITAYVKGVLTWGVEPQ